MSEDFFKLQTGHAYRILIIDDNPEQQRLLLELLRSSGFAISFAFDGHQGYQRALSTKPDLILLDVRMVKVDGFATCRLLKADAATQDIPVIFISAADTPDERIAGLKLGGVDYISKPFVPEEVLARINIHLDLASRARTPGTSSESAPPRHNANVVLVNAVRQFISENLAISPSLAEIAAKVGTYEKKLSQVFREQTGLTVFAFIREERIRRARELLQATDLEIQDIADQVGFQNAANFATAFRQRLGITPSAYRQNLSTP